MSTMRDEAMMTYEKSRLISAGKYVNMCCLDVRPGYDITIVFSESSEITDRELYASAEALLHNVEHMVLNRYSKDRIKEYVESALEERFKDKLVDVVDVFVKTVR